jgi:thermostable 8-oxoguanine DNA glycosylase
MKVRWDIAESDRKAIHDLYRRFESDSLVQERIRWCEKPGARPPYSRESFWRAMVSCLLTSQQRSGPDDPISKIIQSEPFPLGLRTCENQADCQNSVARTLEAIPGIRFYNRVAEFCAANLGKLRNGLWNVIDEKFATLLAKDLEDTERSVAEFLDANLAGFGPKQARHLLLWFGLASHVVLIDSRMQEWLNSHGYPLHISSAMLQDGACYNFVEDGVRELCAAAGIYPTVFDGLVFTAAELNRPRGAKVPRGS